MASLDHSPFRKESYALEYLDLFATSNLYAIPKYTPIKPED